MHRTISIYLVLLTLSATVCLSKEEKRFTPLRPQILAAKTVFLSGGPPDVLDKANGALAKWGRFQIVSDPTQADVVFEFAYGPATTPGLWSESLTITDARSKEVLYEDGRVMSPPSGAGPVIISAFRHYSMARDMVKDLRKRIEATESARTLEYTIQFETRAAKYFTDAAALDEKLATVWPSSAESWKTNAIKDREFAEQLSKSKSEMTKFLGHATVDALLSKHSSEEVRKYRDEILAYTCSIVATQRKIDRLVDSARADLSPEFIQTLNAESADAAALSPDCSSELAIGLLKKQAGKPPSN